jgi:hypothetical protein
MVAEMKVLLLTSYCGDEFDDPCSDDLPCEDCLKMCNVVEIPDDTKIVKVVSGWDYAHSHTRNRKAKKQDVVPKFKVGQTVWHITSEHLIVSSSIDMVIVDEGNATYVILSIPGSNMIGNRIPKGIVKPEFDLFRTYKQAYAYYKKQRWDRYAVS